MEESPENLQNTSTSSIDHIVGKKRKHSDSSLDEQPAEKYLELAEVFTLDRFSDEVLFEIFKHLDALSLLALEKTCPRFCNLVQDRRLWCNIDMLAKQRSAAELKTALNRASKKTESIKINGLLGAVNPSKCKDDRECLLKYVIPKCENLLDIELQNVFVDFMAIKIHDFPKNLKRLVFRDVSVRWPENAPTVFQKMDRSLIWLEELGVESCTWFHPYDIMLFSKCPSLKRLSLRGCQNLSDFVPYGSMASRFGFKSLEYLDIRDTPITDADLQCFNAIVTLKVLLLQCPTYLRVRSPDDKSPSSSIPISYSFTNKALSPTLVDPMIPQSPDSTTSPSESSPSSTSTPSSTTSDGSNDSAESSPNEASTSRQSIRHNYSNVMMTIDLQNQTRTVILHGRVCEIPETEFRRIPHPDNPHGHFGSLLRHPHFWDMIDRQTGPDCGPCVATKPKICPISNRGVTCFGRPENPVDHHIIWIRIGNRPTENSFEKLCLRHYKRVTDDSLKHLVQCSPNLVHLDVSGTGVTQKGVDEFIARKPECTVVCEHLEN